MWGPGAVAPVAPPPPLSGPEHSISNTASNLIGQHGISNTASNLIGQHGYLIQQVI